MAMTFDREVNDSRIVIRAMDHVSGDDYNDVFHFLAANLNPKITSILVVRGEMTSEVKPAEGKTFGERLSILVQGMGISIAVVGSLQQQDSLMVSSTLFNNGVKLAQFDSEDKARNWLSHEEVKNRVN